LQNDLVIGAALGYSPAQAKPFAQSLRRSEYRGGLVLFVHKPPRRWQRFARRYQAIIIDATDLFSSQVEIHPSNLRYFLYQEYLQIHGKNYNRILHSDVRDVVFQGNPFHYPWRKGLKCYLESRENTIENEPFTSGWIAGIFGNDILNQMKDKPISCSGVTMGTANEFLQYLSVLTDLLRRAPLSEHGYDQGAHNYIVHYRLCESLLLYEDSGEMVATISGYRKFKSILLDYQLRVLNPITGKPVEIVHQYDRMPKLFLRWNMQGFIMQLLLRIKACFRHGQRRS
jgi:hypothetical protein